MKLFTKHVQLISLIGILSGIQSLASDSLGVVVSGGGKTGVDATGNTRPSDLLYNPRFDSAIAGERIDFAKEFPQAAAEFTRLRNLIWNRMASLYSKAERVDDWAKSKIMELQLASYRFYRVSKLSGQDDSPGYDGVQATFTYTGKDISDDLSGFTTVRVIELLDGQVQKLNARDFALQLFHEMAHHLMPIESSSSHPLFAELGKLLDWALSVQDQQFKNGLVEALSEGEIEKSRRLQNGLNNLLSNYQYDSIRNLSFAVNAFGGIESRRFWASQWRQGWWQAVVQSNKALKIGIDSGVSSDFQEISGLLKNITVQNSRISQPLCKGSKDSQVFHSNFDGIFLDCIQLQNSRLENVNIKSRAIMGAYLKDVKAIDFFSVKNTAKKTQYKVTNLNILNPTMEIYFDNSQVDGNYNGDGDLDFGSTKRLYFGNKEIPIVLNEIGYFILLPLISTIKGIGTLTSPVQVYRELGRSGNYFVHFKNPTPESVNKWIEDHTVAPN